MFGTLQKRLPQTPLASITGIDRANRFLREAYLARHNARFKPEAEGSAFVPFAGALDDILCIQEAHRRTTTPCATRRELT